MNPGIETDSLIARKVWRAVVVNDTLTGESYMIGQEDRTHVPVPPFSTDIEEAYKIVAFFQNKGWTFRLMNIPDDDVFQACFFQQDERMYRFVRGQTVPLAICAAAIALLDGSNIK
jgi:hypothetical protein